MIKISEQFQRLVFSSAILLWLVLFNSAVVLAEADSKPCDAEGWRQFDFWIGHWTSFGPKGRKQGSNHIHKIMDGCAIQENWTAGGGQYQGTSVNFYNEISGKWRQTWVDNQGGHLQLEGEFNGQSMQLKGSQADGLINRITWSPLENGEVRQHWETSTDDGKTWATSFDGYYRRDSSP